MSKCYSCDKTFNKKSMILECSYCQKIVHATSICTGLSAKQLTALKATESLEWTCRECNINTSRRKSFVTLADREEEDEGKDSEDGADMKQLLQDIRKEVRSIVTQEIRSIATSINYCSEKVDDFSVTLDALTSKIKDMDKKVIHLENLNKSLVLRTDYLEQRNMELEQQLLGDCIEIQGIPDSKDINPPKVVESLLTKLGASSKEMIVSIKRLPTRKSGPGLIHVKVRQDYPFQNVISSAKKSPISLKDLLPNITEASANDRIYVREALTPYLKNLLWQAKQDLNETFKFIWIKEGKLFVRKNEKSRVYKIRSKSDLDNILSSSN